MNNTHSDNHNSSHIPPLDIIDLDDSNSINAEGEISFDKSITEEFRSDLKSPGKNYSGDDNDDSENFFEKYILRINWHIVLLLVFVVCIILLVYRFSTWGTRVESDYDPNNINTELEVESHDNILPLLIDEELMPADDGIRTVVAFGNAPFADARGTDENLTSLIEDLSGAVVYNCSVADSYLAATEPTFNAAKDPMDAFNFYWLTTLATLDNTGIYESAFAEMGDDIPEDAKETYEILTTLDFNTVDVITIMYDASDYLDGRYIYNPENLTDIQSFYGNLCAGIDLIQQTYPHIRIIVMSPTYAYAVNENGDYVSSDLYLYSEHPLSRYSMMLEQGAAYYVVSFVDNFYGTINELNADEYLEDHVHLNDAGRKLVAERFVHALEYYDEE